MPKSNLEPIVLALAIFLALIALILLACAPAEFTAGKVVYQGF